jgi:hypothetical protein
MTVSAIANAKPVDRGPPPLPNTVSRRIRAGQRPSTAGRRALGGRRGQNRRGQGGVGVVSRPGHVHRTGEIVRLHHHVPHRRNARLVIQTCSCAMTLTTISQHHIEFDCRKGILQNRRWAGSFSGGRPCRRRRGSFDRSGTRRHHRRGRPPRLRCPHGCGRLA